jgi:alpha-galactosidase
MYCHGICELCGYPCRKTVTIIQNTQTVQKDEPEENLTNEPEIAEDLKTGLMTVDRALAPVEIAEYKVKKNILGKLVARRSK